MTPETDPSASIAQSLAALRARAKRSALAGPVPIDQIRAAEVADAVRSSPTTPSVGDIARALTLDPSQASRRVKAAIDAGLIVRTSLQHDGRVSGLQLTRKGQRTVEKMQRNREDLVGRAISTWPAEDRAQLALLLHRFLADTDQNGTG